VVAISGTLAMMIPPSIAMIVYGLLADVSIAKLLAGGIVPGIVVTTTIMLTTYFLAKQDPSRAPLSPHVPFRERLKLTRLVAPMLGLIGMVMGAIYSGVTTPTEASALGAMGAAALYFARGRRRWAEVFELVGRATRTSCMIAIILLGAHVFSTFFALTQTTQIIIDWVGGLPVPHFAIILCLVAMYLILGFFMDQMAILVLTVPIVAPLITSLGYDLVWFGVIKIVTAELGMVTPPIGLNCFVVAKYSKRPVSEVFGGTMPHVFTHLIAIAILLLFPTLTLWLPNHMGK
jgi:C4-dicarboxylate transporter, DctM subunit